MRANDVRSTEAIRYGAYACLKEPPARPVAVGSKVTALAARLGLRNEFEPGDGHPPEAIAFLRRVGATPGDIADDGLLHAEAVIHVASARADPVTVFCAELERLLGPAIKPYILGGVVRPPNFTGIAMHNFAYAHQVVQQPGTVLPNAFLVPMSKTSEWWEKDWLERHTYFLPRYDDSGRMLNEGHVLRPRLDRVPHATHLQERGRARPRRRVRLRQLLRMRGRGRRDVPPGLCGLAGCREQSRVEVRARGSDLARTACRNLARAIRMTADVLVLPGANAR